MGSIVQDIAYALATTDVNGIKTVSTEEFSRRIGLLFAEVLKLLSAVIIPLSVICMVIAFILIIVGNCGKSGNTKKYGVILLVSDLGALALYFMLPLIVGLLKHFSKIMNKG